MTADTKSDFYSDLMIIILSAFSRFERNIILERQREGIAFAKLKGKYKGRKHKLNSGQLEAMKIDFEKGIPKTDIAEKYGITRSYIYQLIK